MRRIKAVIVGLVLGAMMWTPTHAEEDQPATPCAYPTICERIPCYFATPSIANTLSNEQIYTFAWFYYAWCW